MTCKYPHRALCNNMNEMFTDVFINCKSLNNVFISMIEKSMGHNISQLKGTNDILHLTLKNNQITRYDFHDEKRYDIFNITVESNKFIINECFNENNNVIVM